MTAPASTSTPSVDERLLRLRQLTHVSRAITNATSLDEVLRLTARRAAELMGADRAVLMLASGEDGAMEVRAVHGIEMERVRGVRERLDETLIRRLSRLLGEEVSETRFLAVPLVTRGEVVGLLAVVRREEEPQVEEDEWLLSALADQAAVALENARLAQRSRELVEEERRAIERVERIRRQALANLAHEVRSPTAAVQSYATLLLEGLYGPISEQQREILDRIRLSGRHLLSVVDSMVEMAHVASGSVRLRMREVDAAVVAEEAVGILLPRAAEKDQSLTTHTEVEGGARVVADPDRLRQSIIALVENAIKFTPPGGEVRISVRMEEGPEGRECCIAVADTGPGIPPERAALIFEPYFREEGDAAGLGLGLAVARGLVQQMGGTIDLDSAPGRGSTFTIRLPASR